MNVRTVSLGKNRVGEGEHCFVIAEAGSNHNGSLAHAKRLIDVAASAGADAVKFQIFRARKLYPRSAGESKYLGLAKSIHDVITEIEMPYEWLPDLAAHSEVAGIVFLGSVFDEESADRLAPFTGAYKIASYEMTHLPLVRYLASTNKPVIMSTGTANLEEVAEAVDAFKSSGNGDLILMQCTAAYPAPFEALNLRALQTMKARFGLPVGLSDHSRDPLVAPIAAVALGANALEKHFTLSNQLPGPDHRFAVEPLELRLMIEKIREAEQALGSGEKVAHPVEEELKKFARRSIFASCAIKAGEVLTAENVAVLRCGNLTHGLPPAALERVLGRRAARALAIDEPLQESDCI